MTETSDSDVAAEAAGVARHWGGAQGLRLLRNRENAVFEARLAAGRAALRLHREGYQTLAAIRSELWWCEALADAGVAVPRPLPDAGGNLVSATDRGRLASMIAWVEGEALGEAGRPLDGDREAQVAVHRHLGALLARMHAATDALHLPDWFERPRWDLDGLLGEAPFWGRFWEHPGLCAEGRDTLAAARDHLRAVIGGHAAAGGDFGLIHADVLRENVLVGPDGAALTLIDFDDSGYGFRLYDLGTALSQNLHEPHFPAIAGALVEGYASGRDLPAGNWPVIEAFTLMRCCASVGWTIPRLPTDHPTVRAYLGRALMLARCLLAGQPMTAAASWPAG